MEKNLNYENCTKMWVKMVQSLSAIILGQINDN